MSNTPELPSPDIEFMGIPAGDKWLYRDEEIHGHSDLKPECTDFVYVITYTNGQQYIGKKTVRSMRRKQPTKKQLAVRKNFKRVEMTDLPFVKYEGSMGCSHELEVEKKEILHQCSTKKTATYIEAALLFNHDVIFDPNYLNENISGTFFDNSLDGLLEDS